MRVATGPSSLVETAKHCSSRRARAAYAARHLPALRAAVSYLEREIARLENQLTETRRRGRSGGMIGWGRSTNASLSEPNPVQRPSVSR
jgi:hypothetical protein